MLIRVCFLFILLSSIACSPAPLVYSDSLALQAQQRLLQPLGSLLDEVLAESRSAKTPDQAEVIAIRIFERDLNKYLKQAGSLNPQIQVQAQWTVSHMIQLQIQVQVATPEITTQAQRQVQFAPAG